MYLLGDAGGFGPQRELWGYVTENLLELHTPGGAEVSRMRELMEQYKDAPMALADATLVAAAETLGLRRVFTLDRHFRAYRINNRETFDIVP